MLGLPAARGIFVMIGFGNILLDIDLLYISICGTCVEVQHGYGCQCLALMMLHAAIRRDAKLQNLARITHVVCHCLAPVVVT